MRRTFMIAIPYCVPKTATKVAWRTQVPVNTWSYVLGLSETLSPAPVAKCASSKESYQLDP